MALANPVQQRSELDALPEANRTIANAYHEWLTGEVKPPPVVCLYGERTGPASALLKSALVFGEFGCPHELNADKLFGLAYFLPPTYDSRLARAYFENAACLMAEKLVTETRRAPTLVILVYSGDTTGRAKYAYCVTVPEISVRNSGWR